MMAAFLFPTRYLFLFYIQLYNFQWPIIAMTAGVVKACTSESWQPLSCWQLRSLGPDTLCSPDKSLSLLSSFSTPFTAVSLLFPTLFSSLLPSLPDSSTIYFSLHLYCLHISTVLASLLSSPLLSSHLYPLHIVSSSHLYSLSTSAVFTSLSSV